MLSIFDVLYVYHVFHYQRKYIFHNQEQYMFFEYLYSCYHIQDNMQSNRQ